MRTVSIALIALSLLAAPARARPPATPAQDDLGRRVMTAVRAAIDPALPYPPSDAAGELPLDGSSAPPWMVRPAKEGDRSIEVLANPLNRDHQIRSAKAMVEIEAAVEAAQQKSQAQYERALADARRTGRSQDIDGITLADEGVAGARIDAESHVTVDVDFNKRSYTFGMASSAEPAVSATVAGAVAIVSVPAHVYREHAGGDERYCPAETLVFFGALSSPAVKRRSAAAFEVTSGAAEGAAVVRPVQTLALRFSGSEELITAIVRCTDWVRIRALLEP